MQTVHIRQEVPRDHASVDALVRAAFAAVPESDQSEAELVRRLRASPHFLPHLCLVAELDNRVVGHVLLSLAHICRPGHSVATLVLAPLSVHPEVQGQGIGSLLVRTVHDLARRHGHGSCMVLGNPDYYGRFGYLEATRFGISYSLAVPQRYCLATELVPGALASVRGMLVYDAAFGIAQPEQPEGTEP